MVVRKNKKEHTGLQIKEEKAIDALIDIVKRIQSGEFDNFPFPDTERDLYLNIVVGHDKELSAKEKQIISDRCDRLGLNQSEYGIGIQNRIPVLCTQVKERINATDEDLIRAIYYIPNELELSKDKRVKTVVSIDKKSKTELKGCNKIYYGLPGCGKSYAIDQICDDENCCVRTVFHPDYTNADFVGQILPCVKDGKVVYAFNPGPFTQILEKALKDEKQMYYLIIEELNRGNAAAIFGEVFQLLDRDEDGSSMYGIDNKLVTDYLNSVGAKIESKIRIPKNMTIFATMNTSDQNVFTLDTAFQRRWQMQRVYNDDKHEHNKDIICETGVTWGKFIEVINETLAERSMSFASTEDKGLGLFFADEYEVVNKQKFAQKVLKYLWDDAFKMNHEVLFDFSIKDNKQLAKIQKAFESSGKFEGIINPEILILMQEKTGEQ